VSSKAAKIWNKTKYQNLLRHCGGKYYARFYISGKEKWVCLETTLIEVAKAKLKEEKKAVEKAQKSGWQPQSGALKASAAIDSYKEDLRLRVGIKDSTRHYYLWVLDSVLKSWPELPNLDLRHITELQCKQWARAYAETYSPTYYNTALLVLKAIFATAIKAGAIYRNPASGIEQKRKKQKALELPSTENFQKLVACIRTSKHRTALHSADLVEFLAYTGCRISEARRVTWQDCDLEKETLTIKGDPNTGTKNWRIRHIPMIADCKKLLIKMLGERSNPKPSEPVVRVGDVRGALKRATQNQEIAHLSHHDMRHLFATTCIESGVDVPTVSRWLGHSDGGVLAMKTYGHLRDEHSKIAAGRVAFKKTQQQNS